MILPLSLMRNLTHEEAMSTFLNPHVAVALLYPKAYLKYKSIASIGVFEGNGRGHTKEAAKKRALLNLIKTLEDFKMKHEQKRHDADCQVRSADVGIQNAKGQIKALR